LSPNQVLTAAAGRYVGYKHTDGDLVLFVDGDMEICAGWVQRAIKYMQENADAAAVGGRCLDMPKKTRPTDPVRLEHPIHEEPGADAQHVGGPAMYRRAALERVGSFNPYLYSDEEPELCLRLRRAGYRIRRLGYPIAFHYTDPAESLSTMVARWRRNLCLGTGQNLRYHLGTDMFWLYARERGYGIVPLLVLALGVGSLLLSIWTRQLVWVSLWVSLMIVGIAMDAYRKRSLRQTLHSLVRRALLLDGTLRGFLSHPRDPTRYPLQVEVIQ
jgi:GT2 family glycosyltransferase